MKRILVVGPIAEREIEATARWYEAREPGLGEGFIVELLRALDDIEERPESFPVGRSLPTQVARPVSVRRGLQGCTAPCVCARRCARTASPRVLEQIVRSRLAGSL